MKISELIEELKNQSLDDEIGFVVVSNNVLNGFVEHKPCVVGGLRFQKAIREDDRRKVWIYVR